MIIFSYEVQLSQMTKKLSFFDKIPRERSFLQNDFHRGSFVHRQNTSGFQTTIADQKCNSKFYILLYILYIINSPVHKRVTLDIQTFNTVLGTSFTFSLLSLFLALSPCQTRINRKTPQLQASLLGLSGLPIPNCQKGSGHKSAQMLLKPVAGIDVNLPPVASSHAFLPCFSTSSMLTSFFNSNPAFSTLIQLFQLQSCFSNPEWLKQRQIAK